MHNSETLTTQTEQLTRIKPPIRRTILFLGVIAFLNTMGLTIIGPVVPFLTLRHLSNPGDLAEVVAWLVSIYGICQMLVAPGLGVLSDRFGRRPILFICLLGSVAGYLIFGLGGALWLLFLGRIIDGLTGGNFSVLFAYIADVTEPEERGKYFGMVGSLSGVGFIVGPSVGGLLAAVSYSLPFVVAAAVMLLASIWAFFFLPESLHREHSLSALRLQDLNPLAQIVNVFTLPNLRWLLLAGFFYYLPFAILQSNLTILLKDSLGWGATPAGLVASVVGVMDIVVQGVLVGRLLTLLGDVKLGIVALLLVALSYLLLGSIALIASPILLVIAVMLFAGSGGLFENALRGLTSRLVGPSLQGRVAGTSQSLQSLALIVGPLFGGVLYAQIAHPAPYWCGTLIIGLAIVCILLTIPMLRTRTTGPAMHE